MLQKETVALFLVSPEHMPLEAVVEEPGEAGSGKGLESAFGVGSSYHLGFGDRRTYMSILLPSHQHI